MTHIYGTVPEGFIRSENYTFAFEIEGTLYEAFNIFEKELLEGFDYSPYGYSFYIPESIDTASMKMIVLNENAGAVSAQFLTDSGKVFTPYANDLWNRLVQNKNAFGYLGERECSVDFDNIQQLNNNLHGIFHRMESEIQENLQKIAEKKLRALAFAEQRIDRIGIENIRKSKMSRLQTEKEEWNNAFTKGRSVVPDVKLILTIRLDG